MDINDVITWLDTREDIVIADKEKFFDELRVFFKLFSVSGNFLKDVKAYCNALREEYTVDNEENHLLVIATDSKTTSTIWGGSIAGIASAYASIAINDHDYVELLDVVSKTLLIDTIQKKFFGHDTD